MITVNVKYLNSVALVSEIQRMSFFSLEQTTYLRNVKIVYIQAMCEVNPHHIICFSITTNYFCHMESFKYLLSMTWRPDLVMYCSD